MTAVQKIALACDHRGVAFKNEVAGYLKSKGYQVVDFGTQSDDSCDYSDFIFPAAESVQRGECAKAIGICYTGIGSSIAANKVKGIRASLVNGVKEAELTRAHNDSNMLILAAGFLPQELLIPIVEKWLTTPFEGGRHEQRINKIKAYESDHAR